MEALINPRSPQLSPLSKEHRAGLQFVDRVRIGLLTVSLEKMRDYVRWYWKNHIRSHLRQEEKILLPYLPKNHEFITKMKDDHACIRDLILEIDHGGNISVFRGLCNLLVAHIRFEEQFLFSWLEKELSEEQLNAINNKLLSFSVEEAEWDDQFWQ